MVDRVAVAQLAIWAVTPTVGVAEDVDSARGIRRR